MSLKGRRPFPRHQVGLAGLCAVLCLPGRALAQAEAQKPHPNVMLLVDTSGSMEFQRDGSPTTCVPGDSLASQKSRWIDLVEVLTGTFNDYSCWTQSRSSTGFRDEFTLGGVVPYDFGYVNAYHRALSNECLYGPGVLPPNTTPYAWPDKTVNTFPLVGGNVVRPAAGALPFYPGCAGFSQRSDGLLDVYKDQVRFGLMTFDARVGAGTGVSAGTADYTGGMDGNWSYYIGSPVTGHPANCSFDMVQEIGARNAAAPPWEGRMVAFGAPDLANNTQRNGWIQDVLLSTRPYGATPIAGQLHDAREFLWTDTSTDPLDSSGTAQFGPTNDPNWRAPNCRKSILVLLTDGEPNLDLRPFCEAEPAPPDTAGRCPYERPEQIVSTLRLSPPTPSLSVETYVVGFALGLVTPFGGGPTSCANVTDTECADPKNNDGSVNAKAVQACCTLNEIAAAGGLDSAGQPRKAYFAEDPAQLRAIFTDILDDVVQVATRTMPVFSSPGGDSQSKGYKFFSAFDPQPNPAAPALWEGILERKRFVCSDAFVAEEQPVEPIRGDDFAANLNSGAGDPRWFYTVVGAGDNRNSIRPFLLTADDGLAISTGATKFADQPSALAPLVPATTLDVTAATCPGSGSAANCRTEILDHAVGLTNARGLTRCPAGACSIFGGIYHSTPTVASGRPSELLRDESYRTFGDLMAADARPTTLYTSTVDGFLHAFNLAPFPGSDHAIDREIKTKTNNELWAFIPPAVLPVMQAQYPTTPAVLLDGVPIIKDVVAFDDEGTLRFERRQAEAQSGEGDWRSVLVQGFGVGQVQGGYFAIDITKPDRTHGPPTFRWQLTRDSDGTLLFGDGGTPLITTVFLNAGTGGPREVPVAVLPGGDMPPGVGTSSPGPVMETSPTGFSSTRGVRNYTGAERARSLTIVRLDTGEIVRTFRPASGAAHFSSAVFTATDIPAPITGQPKAFPELAGAVADRIFVGDREGRLWRVDVSSQNSDDWEMEVFFDAFYDGDSTSSQPVVLPPVLSVNDDGNVTVAFSTGDQDAIAAPDTMVNRVVSLTETLNGSHDFIAKLNWLQDLQNGDRVTGPMVLFNRGLYYSASRPPDTTGAACDVGQSKVFGAHFEHSVDDENDVADPNPLTGPAKAPGTSDLLITSRSDGLIFGVSLEAEPTCSSETETILGNDSFGYGAVSMSKTVKPGRFFLTFEVSGSSADSRGVLEVKQELESPRLPVTFESFALVYE